MAAPTGFGVAKSCVGGSAGATPAYQSNASSSGSGTSLSITKPAGVVAGDLLVASLAVPAHWFTTRVHSSALTGGATPIQPSGWTILRIDSVPTNAMQNTILYKIAGGGEPASYAFQLRVSATWAGAIMRFDGVDPASPFDALDGTSGSSGTSVSIPSVTTVSANALLVALASNANGAANSYTASPSGMTEILEFRNATSVSTGVFTQSFPTAGATGAKTATAAVSDVWAGQILALRPDGPSAAPLYAGRLETAKRKSSPLSFNMSTMSVAAGDLLVIGGTWSGGSGNEPSTPTGFTKVRADYNGTSISSGWWYKVATAGESWPKTITSAGDMAATMTHLKNVNTTTPISGSAVASGSSATMTAPAVTATSNHTVTVHTIGAVEPAASAYNSNGVSADESDYSGNIVMGTSHDLVSGTTTTPTAPWTISDGTSGAYIATSLAINPAPDTYTINANLSWTATASTFATGYTWERYVGAALQQTGTVSPRATVTATDTDSLGSGTAYTYRIRSDYNTWYSTQVSAALTPTCP